MARFRFGVVAGDGRRIDDSTGGGVDGMISEGGNESEWERVGEESESEV